MKRFAILLVIVFASLSASPTTVRVPSSYPEKALENCIEGWVVVQFKIAEKGVTEDVTVVDAEPTGVFEDVAISTAEQWKFEPSGSLAGKRTTEYVQAKVAFELDYNSFPQCRKR